MKIIKDKEKLHRKSNKISIEEADASRIFERLELMLRTETNGVGLSAIQIDESVCACIVRLQGCCVNLLNPEIIESEGEQISIEECLSLPGVVKRVRRPIRVHVIDEYRPSGYIFEGQEAATISHEIEHTQGILITDKGDELTIRRKEPKISPNAKCPKCGRKVKKCEHREEFLK